MMKKSIGKRIAKPYKQAYKDVDSVFDAMAKRIGRSSTNQGVASWSEFKTAVKKAKRK